MNLKNNVFMNAYSIMILIFICVQTIKDNDRKLLRNLYILQLFVTIFLLVVDIFSRFDGHPETLYPNFNHIGNFIMFLCNPLIPSLWLLYAHFQSYHDEKSLKRLMYALLALFSVNAVLLIFSQYYGFFYYIDSENIYHRGSLYWLPVLATLILSVLASIIIILNRKTIDRKYFYSLLLFPLPPLICIALQILFYGSSLILNGTAFSLYIVFIVVQNRSANTDYLTGAYTRKSLESYLSEKIKGSSEGKTFSAILIDLDNFKAINDNFGHDKGDYVLESIIKYLKNRLGANSFIARFGGDEFFIILDISNQEELELMACKLNSWIEELNTLNNEPFKLAISIGYSVYEPSSKMSVADFQKKIDMLMYENKRAHKKQLQLGNEPS